jgi:rSAM/selenodomain-associated transferase 2
VARVSCIVPVLNEAPIVAVRLAALQWLRAAGHELILVDGGSADGTAEIATPWVDRLLLSPPGRAVQMNAGAAAARGDLLWFLHLDAEPPPGAVDALLSAVARGHLWGRFDVRLSGAEPMLRVVERMMNLRSRWTSIATGDQGIFVLREVFERAGGYPVIALMEDIALSKQLKRVGHPACLRQRIVASSRRWEQAGIWRTIVLMWCLRLGYWLGVDPATLARVYDAPRVTAGRRGRGMGSATSWRQ